MKLRKKWLVRLSVLGCFYLGTGLAIHHATEEKEYMTVEVKAGDTIWAIAQSVSSETNQNTQTIVDWILDENQLNEPTIKPGQKLTIPLTQDDSEM